MAKQQTVPAHSFNSDYLKGVKKETFLKAHEHLSFLPLENIWESANKEKAKEAEKPKEKGK